VISGVTNSVIQTIPVGPEPARIAINPITNKTYVSLHGTEKIARIDGTGAAKQISIYSGAPYGIAVDVVRNLVYVATIESFRIVAVDGSSDTFLGWAEIRRLPDAEPVPLRMIAANPLIGTSGHIYVTTATGDLGWDKVLLLPKGWHEYFARAHALPLNEPQEGIVFEPTSLRVFVTSRTGNVVAVYRDGEPACPSNFSLLADHELLVCIGNPDGTCRRMITR
jgi:DNA-binding beta-propeller fold protein YncE